MRRGKLQVWEGETLWPRRDATGSAVNPPWVEAMCFKTGVLEIQRLGFLKMRNFFGQHWPNVNNHHTNAVFQSVCSSWAATSVQFDKLLMWITGQEWGRVPECVLPGKINLNISLKRSMPLPFLSPLSHPKPPILLFETRTSTSDIIGLHSFVLCDPDKQIWLIWELYCRFLQALTNTRMTRITTDDYNSCGPGAILNTLYNQLLLWHVITPSFSNVAYRVESGALQLLIRL